MTSRFRPTRAFACATASTASPCRPISTGRASRSMLRGVSAPRRKTCGPCARATIGAKVGRIVTAQAAAGAARLRRLRLTPHFSRGLEHHVELAKLFFFRQQIAAQTRGEAALRAERHLLERQKARRLLDAPPQLIHRLHPPDFRRD